MKLYEKKISSKQIFDGKIVKLFVDEVELPNGQIATREIVRHPGAVCVVPLTNEGEVVMVKQFRYPFERVLLEIPAGKLEAGEDPLEAVKRELEEESGAVAGKIDHLGEMYTTVAIFDEVIQIYLARDLTFTNAHPDEDEFLEITKIPLSTLIDMVMKGEIRDAKTQIALLKAEKFIKQEIK
jgi:ADP-ribose pyrophosphatase